MAKAYKTRAEVKEVRDDLFNLNIENRQLKNKITVLKAQIGHMYEFVHNYINPVAGPFCALTSAPEGKAALEKLRKDKQERILRELREAVKEDAYTLIK